MREDTLLKYTDTHQLELLWKKASKERGWVYISVNDSIPDTLKIGFSKKDPFTRAKSLSTAGVPGKYNPKFALMYIDCIRAETDIHNQLSKFKLERELFKTDFDTAKNTLIQRYKQDEQSLSPLNISFLLFDQTSDRWLRQFEKEEI